MAEDFKDVESLDSVMNAVEDTTNATRILARNDDLIDNLLSLVASSFKKVTMKWSEESDSNTRKTKVKEMLENLHTELRSKFHKSPNKNLKATLNKSILKFEKENTDLTRSSIIYALMNLRKILLQEKFKNLRKGHYNILRFLQETAYATEKLTAD
jgi:hypothetical protein